MLCSISDDSEQSEKTFLFVRMPDRMLTIDITINCYLMDLTPIVDVWSTVKPTDIC